MLGNEYVILKGTAGGVNMVLDAAAEMNDILDCMRDKIKSANGFFKGECNVYVSGRDLSKADKLRISSVMNTIFPEANLVFHQEITDNIPDITPRNHTDKGAKFMEELLRTAEASKHILKGKSPALKPQKFDVKLYAGTVGDGECVSVLGDLLIVGNVEPEGKAEASGNLYIMGRLSGHAICGTDGNKSSHVIATGFQPRSVTICGTFCEFDNSAQECLPKMAYLLKDEIFTEKIL